MKGMEMKTLIVYESMFGSTRMIAEAIAEAVRTLAVEVTVTAAADAPVDLAGYDLVIVGCPTHAHSLPRASSREQAADWADDPEQELTLESSAMRPGVREWLKRLTGDGPHPRFAAFSTRADVPRIFAGDAAVAIKRRLHKLDIQADAHEDFLVDSKSHLVSGEQQRARDWALQLIPVTSRSE